MANAKHGWRAGWLAAAAMAAWAVVLPACGGDDGPAANGLAVATSTAIAESPTPRPIAPTADTLSVGTATPTAPGAVGTATPPTGATATATALAVTPSPATPTKTVDDPVTPTPAYPSPSPTDAPETTTPAPPGANTLTITQGAQLAAVEVEYAATEADREHGLMGRDTLPDSEGMLFVFPTLTSVPFWMKDTPNPLDIAFIAEDGTVLGIAHGEPFDLTLLPPPSPYNYVLEVAGGWFARVGLGVGAKVTLPSGMPAAAN